MVGIDFLLTILCRLIDTQNTESMLIMFLKQLTSIWKLFFQLQKLDITRHYEHERDQLNRVKVERDQIRNDMKILKERENERERHRDHEKITDKRSARQIERERDEFKMKLVRFGVI